MEELVSSHSEFIQMYGRPNTSGPPWLEPAAGVSPDELICKLAGSHNLRHGNWNSLYSAGDVSECIQRVHQLRYGEVTNIDGMLLITPSSSGLEIGASNWVLTGTQRSLTYISPSVLATNHAMPAQLSSLEGSDVLLFSDVDISAQYVDEKFFEEGGGEMRAVENPVDLPVNEIQQASEVIVSAPKQSSQRTPASPASSVSHAPPGPSVSSAAIPKLPLSVASPVAQEKLTKAGSEENEGTSELCPTNVDERIVSLCKASVDAVSAGGCVLIPASPNGTLLELIEEMALHLRAAGLEQVPLLYISPVAEEMLAYSNTVPEWLIPQRQEKLYAGEALFGHVELLQQKQLYHFPALYHPDLMRCWQEPCVVFATHWSLRMGPAVHLLHQWRHNPLCLLILTEPNMDVDLLLSPFKPITIQVLHFPVVSKLRLKEVASIVKKLHPQLTIVPDSTSGSETLSKLVPGRSVVTLIPQQTLQMPKFQENSEVNLSADLAVQIQLKQIKSGKVTAARFSADLHVKDGLCSLEIPSPSPFCGGTLRSLPRHQCRWGTVSVDSILTALREHGIYDVMVIERPSQDQSKDGSDTREVTMEIQSPSPARIELKPTSTNIHANVPSLRRLLVDVVTGALHVL